MNIKMLFLALLCIPLVGCNGSNKKEVNKKEVRLARKAERKAKKAQRRAHLAAAGNNDKLNTLGSVRAVNTTYVSVDVLGDAELDGVKIAEKCKVLGKAHFNDVTIGGDFKVLGKCKQLNRVQVNGDCSLQGKMTLDDVKVMGSWSILGDAKMQNVRAAKGLDVLGSVTVSNKSNIQGLCSVQGDFKSADSTFEGVQFTAEKNNNRILFKDSMLESLTVRAGKAASWKLWIFEFTINTNAKEAIVELDGSRVAGDITFKGIPGIVILKNGARLAGQVIGGTVQE
jgi:hypothetical protein